MSHIWMRKTGKSRDPIFSSLLSPVSGKTHVYVIHAKSLDSFFLICRMWRDSCICDKTHVYVVWLRDVTHSYVSFICLIHIRGMTHVYVAWICDVSDPYDSFLCAKTHVRDAWLLHMAHAYVARLMHILHNSVMWVIHMTHSYVARLIPMWQDSCTALVTRSYDSFICGKTRVYVA